MTNPVSGGFQFTPATGLNDAATYPSTPVSETAARQQFMDMYWQLMNEMNLPTLSAASYGLYNKLINGNFDVWQRGTSSTNPTNGIYLADRWKISVGSGTMPANIVHSRQILTTGDIPNSYFFYRVAPDGAGTTPQLYRVSELIENGARYLCGLNKKVTISFWAKSSISGKKIGIFAQQNYGTTGSPSASENINGQNFTLTSTWTKYTLTLTTNTLVGKTFGTDNNDFLSVNFTYCWDASQQALVGASVAETFVGAGNIDIAQVQVNAGDQALLFQPRSFAEELALCQRYYEKSYPYGTTPSTPTILNGLQTFFVGTSVAANNIYGAVRYKVQKRTSPTVTIYPYATPSNTGRVSGNDGVDLAANSGQVEYASDSSFTIFNGSVGAVTPSGNSIIFHYAADSEL